MTLLINGCSFAEVWPTSSKFVKDLECDNLVNLGVRGTSFSRTVRTTIEWIAQNGNPKMVIIPITLSHRSEISIARQDDQLEGTWFPIQRKELINNSNINNILNVNTVKSFIDHYYGIIPDIRTHWDLLFTQIISLAGFLQSRKIKYLMFDMCNDFKLDHIKNFKSFSKINFIKEDKNIIDLFSFCGNKFMWDTLLPNTKEKTNSLLHHHDKEQYVQLEKQLISYINSCI